MKKVTKLFKIIFVKRKKLLIFLAVVLVGFIGWKILSNKNQQPQFQTVKVERGTVVSSVTASGQVLTANMINITTGASGVVKQVYVKDGDTVAAGQKISEITLDLQGQQKNASVWSSYLSAKNSVDSANATFYSLQSDMFAKWRTFKDLAESVSYDTSEERTLPQFHIAEKDWLAAEAKYKNQQGVLDQAKASLNSAWLSYQLTSPVITAPVAGTVSDIGLVEGMVLNGNQSTSTSTSQTTGVSFRAAVIQSTAASILTFNLTEIDAPKVKIGQKATITLDSLPDKTFTGKVATIDKIGTTSNNVTNYPVIIQLDTTSADILPNMAANANIIIEAKNNVLFVPSAAIQTQNGEFIAQVLINGREQLVPVQVGLQSDTQTEIISGLSEGDEVVSGTVINSSNQQRGSSFSPFGGGFGGGTLRPGGGQRR